MQNNGLTDKLSSHSVDEALRRAQEFLAEKAVTVFALIDHSGEAQKVGLTMPPTKLLVFGNPRGGTPVMLAAPSVAIDLPLKLLIWQDPQGQVRVTYNTPVYLVERHGVPENLMQNLALVEMLASHAAG